MITQSLDLASVSPAIQCPSLHKPTCELSHPYLVVPRGYRHPIMMELLRSGYLGQFRAALLKSWSNCRVSIWWQWMTHTVVAKVPRISRGALIGSVGHNGGKWWGSKQEWHPGSSWPVMITRHSPFAYPYPKSWRFPAGKNEASC